MNIDDIIYPLFLEYYADKDEFYNNQLANIKKLFSDLCGGQFIIKKAIYKNGQVGYVPIMNYKGHMIKANSAFTTKGTSLKWILYNIKFIYNSSKYDTLLEDYKNIDREIIKKLYINHTKDKSTCLTCKLKQQCSSTFDNGLCDILLTKYDYSN